MCGIAGIISFSGHNQEEAKARIKRMTDTISHRGPDAEGFHVDGQVAFGHRRLSIIDLESGQQPMASEDERVWIVFNGEIYNYLDMRNNLESDGYRFRTNSDTETILNAYLKWGSGCVEKLNGMFAFAIWDRGEEKVLMARDRVGKKPLYYCHQNETFYFASELKALLAAGVDTGEICLEALDNYFSFGYIPVPQTIFKNVYKLRPAHTLEICRQSMKRAALLGA